MPVATLIQGGRLGATYMGFVVLLRVVSLVVPELSRSRGRRLYAIAWQSWTEAFRRMWAPWVVLVLFAVILAFTSWFLQPARPAEMGRLYVGTLMLLCSILLTFTIVILAPISLPNDIRQQTIYTVVSKPVRRLEMIWGRILGYMALVTVLMLLFGGISLIYFNRMVGAAIRDSVAQAERYEQENKTELARAGPRAGRPAPDPDVGAAAGLRLADLLRLPRRPAPAGHRRRHGAATPQLRRGGDPVAGDLAVRASDPEPVQSPARSSNRPCRWTQFLVPARSSGIENELFNRQDEILFAGSSWPRPTSRPAETKELTATIGRAEAASKTLQAQLDKPAASRSRPSASKGTDEARAEADACTRRRSRSR